MCSYTYHSSWISDVYVGRSGCFDLYDNVRALTMLEESLTVMPKCDMWLLRIP